MEPEPPGGSGAPLFGRNPVLELLRTGSRRVEEIAILSEGRGPALHELLGLAKRQGVKISYRTRDQLTAMAGDIHHQGVVARVAGASYAALGDLLEIPAERGEPAFFLALDQVQDPRNLGAVLRTAEATGAHGVIVPKHHAAGLTGAAAKSAMGAAELIPVARETNLVHALEILKKEGVWTVGAVPAGGQAPVGAGPDRSRLPGAGRRGGGASAPRGQELRLPGEPPDARPARIAERFGRRGRAVLRGAPPAECGNKGLDRKPLT